MSTDPTQMTVFQLMRQRLQMLGQRQRVISENVANVSTPGFTPNDVDQEAFANTMKRIAGQSAGPGKVAMMVTNPGHMTPPHAHGANVTMMKAPDSETTLDGNQVVVEEQMMKIADTRTEFETMVGLYQKSLGLLKLATRSPSR
jgi:flagellar basal-body rod protein FlgB